MFFPLLLQFVPGTYAGHLAVAKLGGLGITAVSGQIHYRRTRLNPHLLFVLAFGGLIGTGFGTYLIQHHLNEVLFRALLGFSLLIGATYLAIKQQVGKEKGKRRPVTRAVLAEAGIFALGVGVLNGLFGGTGIFTTLYLVFFFHIPFRKAIAYTMLSYLLVNMFQVMYLWATESVNLFLALLIAGGAMAGAYVGTHFQYIKGSAWIKTAAISIMVILGISNVWAAIGSGLL